MIKKPIGWYKSFYDIILPRQHVKHSADPYIEEQELYAKKKSLEQKLKCRNIHSNFFIVVILMIYQNSIIAVFLLGIE